MSVTSGVIDRVRRPEYTGENRCIPCTAVNLVIAGLGALAVALLLPSPLAPWVGAAGFLLAAATVYLRGYLVPGTPWFTRTYFPERLLRLFDKHPAPPTGPEGEVDVEAALVEAGALAECADVDDLCLTPDFRAAWRERIAALDEEDTSREDLAAVLGTDPDRLSFSEFGTAFTAHDGGVRVGQWESKAAFTADVAAASVLAPRVAAWDGLGQVERGSLLTGLRLFVERCPSCDGPVEVEEEVKKSCCRSWDVVASTCADCGARLFEAQLPDSA